MTKTDRLNSVLATARQTFTQLQFYPDDQNPASVLLKDVYGNAYGGVDYEPEHTFTVPSILGERTATRPAYCAWVQGMDPATRDRPADYYDVRLGCYHRPENAVLRLIEEILRHQMPESWPETLENENDNERREP